MHNILWFAIWLWTNLNKRLRSVRRPGPLVRKNSPSTSLHSLSFLLLFPFPLSPFPLGKINFFFFFFPCLSFAITARGSGECQTTFGAFGGGKCSRWQWQVKFQCMFMIIILIKKLLLGITDMLCLTDQLSLTTDCQFSRHIFKIQAQMCLQAC